MSKYGTGKVILGEWGCLFFISRTLNNVLLFLFFRASGFWIGKNVIIKEQIWNREVNFRGMVDVCSYFKNVK